ncbi:hypothetical protein [Vulcanisaeta distributa]|uniref:Uncharacterized protein n=1 Tax=Vulcanisaeta distributa (strain DSM 14429 / JCM 11212 / NBRC 100878 / IC-017) TaxID=572478 RepID=E1QUV7_VULDI|nr:hypothetical protein [Vulcanisaeta distributa]ADN49960.1 hypothetical protein Vdis_0562 [Vulcanisaeta distributa DSM 14429]
MVSEDVERLKRNPEILIEALNELLTTNPEALIRALMNRPETLIRLVALTASLPLVIPTMLLRILAALANPLGSPGDMDALRARISDVERRLDDIESKMVKREDLESLIKELISKYGVKG